MPGQIEHDHRGWKIKITDKTVDAEYSARIQVWKPGHDPRSDNDSVAPFLKRTASRAEAQDAAFLAAKEWIDREIDSAKPKN